MNTLFFIFCEFGKVKLLINVKGNQGEVSTMSSQVIYRIDKSEVAKIASEIRIIMFDLDGTLTKVTSMWEYVHKTLGVWDKAEKYKELAFAGKITYEEWARLDASLWKGTNYETMLEIIDKVPFVDDLEEVVKELKRRGYVLAVITAGLDIIKVRLQKLGFDYVIGNQLVFRNGVVTGEVNVKVKFDEKDIILKDLALEHGYTLDHCAAVGDGINDIRVFKEVRLAIAFNPMSEDVEKNSHIIIKGDSLKPLLDIFK